MGRIAFIHRGRPEGHIILRRMIHSIGISKVDCFNFFSIEAIFCLPFIFGLGNYERIVISDPLIFWFCPWLFLFRNIYFFSFEMFEYQLPNARLKNFLRNLMYLVSHYLVLLFCQNVFFPNDLRKTFYLGKIKKLSKRAKVFPNYFRVEHYLDVDLSSFPKEYEKLDLENNVIFLYAGSIEDERCFDEIFRAFANPRIKSNRLLLVAGFADQQILNKYNNKSVHFLGKIPYEKMLSLYRFVDYGFATYSNSILNTRFCAPVKLYEYWHFGIEVISNENFSLLTYKNEIKHFFSDQESLVKIINNAGKSKLRNNKIINFDEEFKKVFDC